MLQGHILTGPVAIEGAEPGDVLEVDILDVQLRQDWGWNLIRPLSGTLPDDFHETRILNIPLDRERMVGRMPWGLDLPLKPFFGVMGVAPPPAWGRITSLIPRAMGGNLDNKELDAGAKLYLPVFVPGALFSCGDGHGVQGDGEVCVTAIETALQGRFRLTLRKDLRLDYPRAETPDHYMTMAMDPDLDQCVVRALRDMIVLARREAQSVARGRLHALQPRRRSAGDANRQRLQGHSLHDRKGGRARLTPPSEFRTQLQPGVKHHAGFSDQRRSIHFRRVGGIGAGKAAGDFTPAEQRPAADRLRVLVGDQFAAPFAVIGAIGARVIEI